MGIIVGFSTIWFKEITDENPIWPLFRGHNSKRLPYPTGKHPEINGSSYILSKKYTKTSPTRDGRGYYGRLFDYVVQVNYR